MSPEPTNEPVDNPSDPPESSIQPERTKYYLDYLDKEMTIMGLLSTFCVIVVGAVLNCALGAAGSSNWQQVWENGAAYLMLGSALILLGAGSFYLQRSFLALVFGELSMNVTMKLDVTRVLGEADSWPSWMWYRYGFALAIAGFAEYFLALIAGRCEISLGHRSSSSPRLLRSSSSQPACGPRSSVSTGDTRTTGGTRIEPC